MTPKAVCISIELLTSFLHFSLALSDAASSELWSPMDHGHQLKISYGAWSGLLLRYYHKGSLLLQGKR